MENVEMQPFISEARNDPISEEDDGLYVEFGALTENQGDNKPQEFEKLNDIKTEPSKVENEPIYEKDDGVYEVPYSSANEGRVFAVRGQPWTDLKVQITKPRFRSSNVGI